MSGAFESIGSAKRRAPTTASARVLDGPPNINPEWQLAQYRVQTADGTPPLRNRKFVRLSAGGRWIRTFITAARKPRIFRSIPGIAGGSSERERTAEPPVAVEQHVADISVNDALTIRAVADKPISPARLPGGAEHRRSPPSATSPAAEFWRLADVSGTPRDWLEYPSAVSSGDRCAARSFVPISKITAFGGGPSRSRRRSCRRRSRVPRRSWRLTDRARTAISR